MNWKLLLSGLLLSGGLLVSGCSMLPSPESTIMAPQLAGAQTLDSDPLKTVVQKFLPSGAKLETPKNPGGTKSIQQRDLDGDGKAELLATYRVGQNPGELGAVLLQEQQNKWQKVWELNEALGIALDHASFADITGDGRPELLLGWAMDPQNANGVEHCGLDIFAWQGNESGGGGGVAFDAAGNEIRNGQWQGTLTLMEESSRGYEKMDVLNAPDQEDTGKKAALALWHHLDSRGEKVYNSDSGEEHYYPGCAVLRWEKFGSDTGWAPAEDLYPHYYKKVVAFYRENVKEIPEDPFYWYNLARIQVKANLAEDALKSITEGEAIKSDAPKNSHWLIVKGEALNKLGKYEEARSTLTNAAEVLEQGNGNLSMAYFNLGQSYAGLKETDKAKAAYEKSLEIIKQDEKRYNYSGYSQQPMVQRALEKL
ncbi:Repeat domain-containing protein [Desulfotomaculum arcticum]|uniref:Repeat domain-containing protein n=1 Tax=Desulfotruncus arcticus DSM 17038 TaxID=1121424 RepID=A0A1I2W2Q2_9FIRM|nr:tetratricopeptide repeat protein [Desulfotruncus arcticus]SFG94326.1 Repeat domain-containing protein [Desulfotomaculum arcticum] [Desulfotruncus arcticus DSM 17038]